MVTRNRKKSKGKGGNTAAQQHRQMPLLPVSDAGQSKIASDETVKSTESPERHHGKEQPFSKFDIATIGLTAIGSASTAVGLADAGESLWSTCTGVVFVGSAWCTFLASFFPRQGFAEVLAEVRATQREVHALHVEVRATQREVRALHVEVRALHVEVRALHVEALATQREMRREMREVRALLEVLVRATQPEVRANNEQ